MRKLVLVAGLGGLLLVLLTGGSLALAKQSQGGGFSTAARLIGYNETPSVSSVGRGEFRAEVSGDVIEYRLSYQDLEGATTTQAHIHFGQPHFAGGVSVFLCGGGDKPACPPDSGQIEGTIDAADVIGPAAQGIAAGELGELVRAIRAGAAYVNVHSSTWPGGEIRGQLRSPRLLPRAPGAPGGRGGGGRG